MYKDYEVKLNAILDTHKGVKRFDLKDIKTLDKLSGELEKIARNLDGNLTSKVDDAIATYNVSQDKVDKISIDLEQTEKEYDDTRKRIEEEKKQLKIDEKVLVKEQNKWQKSWDKKVKDAKKVFSVNDKYKAAYKKGEGVKDKLKTAIKQVEQSAKDLGVKVNVSEYETIVKLMDGQVPDAAKYLQFDY